MFLESFKVTGIGVLQIFILGAIGYFLVKRQILSEEGLANLSRITVEITFPIMIFTRLVTNFSFDMYPNWWLFPLISFGVNLSGFLLGAIFTKFIHGQEHKMQFLSLATFQNSGWLPLALAAAMLTQAKLEAMFIYLFLFLLGFDLAVWSFGVYMLTFHMATKFELRNFFSPPVIANIFSLLIIFLGLHTFIPQAVIKPLQMAGDTTLPLALFVVGGNLAAIRLSKVDKKAMGLMILSKLIILPLIGLWFVLKLRLPELIGLLIVMQLAMPSATSLSLIIRHHRKEDLYISQGIFFGHIVSLLTIPVFLSLYFSLTQAR